jgi:hypothetical protein
MESITRQLAELDATIESTVVAIETLECEMKTIIDCEPDDARAFDDTRSHQTAIDELERALVRYMDQRAELIRQCSVT